LTEYEEPKWYQPWKREPLPEEKKLKEHYERLIEVGVQKDFAVPPPEAVVLKTKAEFDALPPGTAFIAPDGSRGVK